MGAGGSDFGDYRAVFDALGVDMSWVVDVPSEFTGSAFMSADLAGNQIAGFYPGASYAAARTVGARAGPRRRFRDGRRDDPRGDAAACPRVCRVRVPADLRSVATSGVPRVPMSYGKASIRHGAS